MLKKKEKRRQKRKKAQCLEYFHMANWCMAWAAISTSEHAEKGVKYSLCLQGAPLLARAPLPAGLQRRSQLCCSWSPAGLSLSLFISLCAQPGLQTLGRATPRLRDTNFPHSSSGVGARAAASPHKSHHNWVIRDRGHGDPHVTASQSPACPALTFCFPARIWNSPILVAPQCLPSTQILLSC